MELAVILLSWKNKAETWQQIEVLGQWQQLRPLVIVVENEAEVPSFGQANSCDGRLVNLVSKENRGYGGGINLGLRTAAERSARFALLLNPDAEVAEPEVAKLVALLQNDPKLFSVGPLLLEGTGDRVRAYAGGQNIALHLNTRRAWHGALPAGQAVLPSDYTPGAVALFRVSHCRQVGFLDEKFFFSGEIADWCYRAALAGLPSKTLLGAVGHHHAEDSPRRQGMYIYYNFRNRFLFVKKHQLGPRLQWRWGRVVLLQAVFFLFRGKTGSARAALLALVHGLLGKFGNQNKFFIG